MRWMIVGIIKIAVSDDTEKAMKNYLVCLRRMISKQGITY